MTKILFETKKAQQKLVSLQKRSLKQKMFDLTKKAKLFFVSNTLLIFVSIFCKGQVYSLKQKM